MSVIKTLYPIKLTYTLLMIYMFTYIKELTVSLSELLLLVSPSDSLSLSVAIFSIIFHGDFHS